jgi:hypothetical protein
MPAAWDDAEAILRLADGLLPEPAIICQLVRLAQVDLAIRTVGALSAIQSPDADVRARVNSHLLRQEDRSPFILAIDGERLLFGEWMFRNFGMRVNEEDGLQSPPFGLRILARPWLSINRAHYLRVLHHYASGMQQPIAEFPFGQADEKVSRIPRYCVLARMIVPSLDGFYVRCGERLAQARLARIGLAIAAYRAEHGTLPADLESITTDLLPQVPEDPFTGKPFIYRPDHGLLYGLGPNRQDDRGRTRMEARELSELNEHEAWDVTWRFPTPQQRP